MSAKEEWGAKEGSQVKHQHPTQHPSETRGRTLQNPDIGRGVTEIPFQWSFRPKGRLQSVRGTVLRKVGSLDAFLGCDFYSLFIITTPGEETGKINP